MNSIQEQLLYAVVRSDLEGFKVCLTQGADVNQRHGSDRKTLLHFVSSVEIVQELLLLGLDVNARDKNGQTPLHSALASNKKLAVVRELLINGGDVKARDCFGQTLFNFVSSAEAAKELLHLGLDINVRDRTGRTPLHWAIMHNKELSVIRELLESGADIGATDVNGHTPLHCAVIYSSEFGHVARDLVSRGSDPNARDNWDGTPLHWAIMRGKGVSVVRDLLLLGADVNARDSEGNTALYLAVRHHRNLQVITELVDSGADITIRSLELSENDEYYTPFALAVNRNYMDCAKLIIKLTIIKRLDGSYCKAMDLDKHVESPAYSELLLYVQECLREIETMKTDKVGTNLTLYNFVTKQVEAMKPLYPGTRNLEEEIVTKYPIYCGLILPNVKLCLERAILLDKLEGLNITTRSDTPVPNYDCIFKIAEFLTNDDLLNFIAAFGSLSFHPSFGEEEDYNSQSLSST